MRWLFAVMGSVLLSFISTAPFHSAPQTSTVNCPFYSAKAIYTYEGEAANSPDGNARVQTRPLDDDSEFQNASIIAQTRYGKLVDTIQFGLDAEVLWSPDSKAFTVTGSRTGANGVYETAVFYLRDHRLEKIELSPLITRAFGHPVKCGWSEPPNVAAIKWLIPSRRLLVAAEIIHHSNCDSFGTFRAYVVELTALRINKVYNQIETKRLFGGDLGPELLQADDGCIRNPISCFVPFNHPK
jgi:hypothetical protein